jgi:hypothetical protein
VVSLNELALTILLVGWMGGFGLAAAMSATRVERFAPLWFVFGAILGPIAVLLLRMAPPGRCRTCGTPTLGWFRTCWWCHEDVRSTPASTLAIVARMSTRNPDPAGLVEPPITRRPDPPRPFVIADPGRPPKDPPGKPPARQPFVLADAVRPVPRASPKAPPPLPPAARGILPESEVPTPAPGVGSGRNGAPVPAGSSGRPRQSASAPRSNDGRRVLATAVFVAGSARLVPGHRYGIALQATRLLVLGPADIDPSAIVLDRSVADIDVRTMEGRLVFSEPLSGSGLVLAFMSVAGASTADLESAVTEAARSAGLT